MALMIRLRQQGRANRLVYRLVLTDAKERRDGKYSEALGWYNPAEKEDSKNVFVNADRLQHWLGVGAVLSEKAEALVKRAAPEVMREFQEKKIAHKTKMAAKRRSRKQKAA